MEQVEKHHEIKFNDNTNLQAQEIDIFIGNWKPDQFSLDEKCANGEKIRTSTFFKSKFKLKTEKSFTIIIVC